jgi:hypothetical protein
VSPSTRPADVRFYFDADVLGLAKVVARLRFDATFPGDPGATIHRRERAACPITDPATPDRRWIPEVTERGWLIVARDRRIQERRAEIDAVQEYGAKMVRPHRTRRQEHVAPARDLLGLLATDRATARTHRPVHLPGDPLRRHRRRPRLVLIVGSSVRLGGERCRLVLVGGESGDPGVEFLAGEVPGERFGDLVVEPLEVGEALLDLIEV